MTGFIHSKWFAVFKYMILIMGIAVQIIAYKFQLLNLFVWGFLLIFIHNILFYLEQYSKRFIYLLFNITFFTFLVSRPVIAMFRGEEWWRAVRETTDSAWFALTLVGVSLYSLIIGGYLAEFMHNKCRLFVRRLEEKNVKIRKEGFKENLQVVSMLVFYVTYPMYFLQELEPLLFSNINNYMSYYTDFQNGFPALFYTLASFMKISLCIFLATFPRKRRAFVPLVLFAVSAIPSLIIGLRNPIVLNSLFILVYYLFRETVENKEKWMGKFEKIIVGCSAPIMTILMMALAYIRAGMAIKIENPLRYITDFFYSQGVTFNVIQLAYGYIESMRLQSSNYTFGGIIDYIYRGTLGQKIFGTEGLPSGNTLENAELSHNLSHHLSYATMKEEYLSGRGWGSSYILESYVDFDYIGVVVIGLIIGFFLIYAVYWFGKNIFVNTVILMALTTFFLIPRAEATGWLTFIVTIQFWVCLIGCYLAAFVAWKCKFIHNIIDRLHLYPKADKNTKNSEIIEGK